jgi:hypothetical protein
MGTVAAPPYDALMATPTTFPVVTGDPEADELNVRDPLALLTGMLLGQQMNSTCTD